MAIVKSFSADLSHLLWISEFIFLTWPAMAKPVLGNLWSLIILKTPACYLLPHHKRQLEIFFAVVRWSNLCFLSRVFLAMQSPVLTNINTMGDRQGEVSKKKYPHWILIVIIRKMGEHGRQKIRGNSWRLVLLGCVEHGIQAFPIGELPDEGHQAFHAGDLGLILS